MMADLFSPPRHQDTKNEKIISSFGFGISWCLGVLVVQLFFADFSRAQEATPVPTPDSTVTEAQPVTDSGPSSISMPAAVTAESNPAVLAPNANQKPSQGEGEKAPVQARPTAVPDFSLPEVVITGENELTIGAKRLDRKENDVTLGSHDLSAAERAVNDLPGIDKTFTALSTEESGPAKDTALILHAGGGTPSTYGGWGLFGQQFKDIQYLLSGYYSNWGGQATGTGFDGDRKYRFGLETNILPSDPLSFHFAGSYGQTDAELPYQNSLRELHQGLDLNGDSRWKLSDLVQVQAKVSYQTTALDYWDSTPENNQTQELEGHLKFSADDIDPVFNRFSLEVGGRHATSDFLTPVVGAYDWGWVALQAYVKNGESLGLTAKLQAQGGDGLDLPFKLFPSVDLMWRAFQSSQLDLYWQTDRYVDSFYKTFMDTEHISPEGGFPSPTEVTNEFGGRFTQKITERIIASVSGSVAQISNYHEWTDINALMPVNIQDYATLSNVQILKIGANIQWSFMKNWQAAAAYEWKQGTNNAGDGLITGLPTNRGVVSLYRGDDKLETRLSVQGASETQAYQSLPGTLPAYITLNLDATYHWTKELSLWLAGDNLLGQGYYLQPGYLEPQYHIRGGLEVIF